MMGTEARNGSLAGLRVIDLSRVLAGPLCTMTLGDLGADVIKIEQPGRGDETRGWGPPFVAGESAYFLSVNRNKRSVTLNLKDARGQEILKELLRSADVVVENFKVGTLDGWGITEDWRAREAPQLVHCQITGYGSHGPKAGQPGYDFLLQAESGLMSITGEPTGAPMKLGVAIVDVCTGLQAAVGILAALQARERTGHGQRVQATLYATSLSMLINVASNYLVSDRRPARFGNAHPNIVPYRDFDCADAPIAIAVGNDDQFRRLAQCLGHAEWADDPRFRTNADRVENRETIEGMIRQGLAMDSSAAWMGRLEEAGIPCGRVNTVDEALANAQTNAANMVVEVEHSAAGALRMLGIPIQLSDTPSSIVAPPPVLGAHTESVLRELGYDATAIRELHDGEVL